MSEINDLTEQYNNCNSLKTKLTLGMKLINELCQERRFDQVITIGTDALPIAQTLENYDYCFQICYRLAMSYSMTEQEKKSLEICQKELFYAELSKNNENIALAYMHLGIASNEQNNFKDAYVYFSKSVDICLRHNFFDVLMRVYLNIGDLAFLTGNYNLALEYLKKGIKATSHEGSKALFLARISDNYHALQDYVLSVGYMKKAIIIRKKLGNVFDLVQCYINLCIVEIKRKNFIKAKEYAQILLQSAQENKFEHLYATIYVLTAIINISLEEDVEISVEKALSNYNNNVQSQNIASLYHYYSVYLENKKDFEKALLYRKKYIDITAEIVKTEKKNYHTMLQYALEIPTLKKQKKIGLSDIPKGFSISIAQKSIFIAFHIVQYIEIKDHYLHLYLSNGQVHRFLSTKKKITQKLDERFLEIHRSYIVNMDFILSIGGKSITLKNNVNIPCSKNISEIKNRFLDWMVKQKTS